VKGRAKWEAWSEKKGLAKEEAMKQYVAKAGELMAKHGTR